MNTKMNMKENTKLSRNMNGKKSTKINTNGALDPILQWAAAHGVYGSMQTYMR
jgi:hypothetical protein